MQEDHRSAQGPRLWHLEIKAPVGKAHRGGRSGEDDMEVMRMSLAFRPLTPCRVIVLMTAVFIQMRMQEPIAFNSNKTDESCLFLVCLRRPSIPFHNLFRKMNAI